MRPRTSGRLHRAAGEERVVAAERFVHAATCNLPDGERNDHPACNAPGTCPYPVAETTPAVVRSELEQRAKLRERTAPVAANHTEPLRAHPFERLLLELDAAAELEPQAATARRRCRTVGRQARDGRRPGLEVEAVRVGNERPECLRARPKVPFPAILELFRGHAREAYSARRGTL